MLENFLGSLLLQCLHLVRQHPSAEAAAATHFAASKLAQQKILASARVPACLLLFAWLCFKLVVTARQLGDGAAAVEEATVCCLWFTFVVQRL
jgi:hypothetical protein